MMDLSSVGGSQSARLNQPAPTADPAGTIIIQAEDGQRLDLHRLISIRIQSELSRRPKSRGRRGRGSEQKRKLYWSTEKRRRAEQASREAFVATSSRHLRQVKLLSAVRLWLQGSRDRSKAASSLRFAADSSHSTNHLASLNSLKLWRSRLAPVFKPWPDPHAPTFLPSSDSPPSATQVVAAVSTGPITRAHKKVALNRVPGVLLASSLSRLCQQLVCVWRELCFSCPGWRSKESSYRVELTRCWEPGVCEECGVVAEARWKCYCGSWLCGPHCMTWCRQCDELESEVESEVDSEDY